ncbi:MAG TPA: ABC transporter ATP-binding protein [Trebonia sp.]|nr:ABC transporter ATP-binding protein [Trebonia sp.]
MTPSMPSAPAVPADRGRPEAGPLLSVTGLHAGWGGLAVVRDVDMHIGPGEIVALLGPNGAGKTTVLKTVAGLLPVIKGEIRVLGRAPSVRRPHLAPRRGLAYVPDDRCLFRSLTTRQNLALAARRGEISAVYEYLPELRGLIDRQAGLLSGGEQQMLAIARALLMRPRLLMIDELSMGLAPVIVTRLLDVVHDVSRSLGISVLIVEQHVRMALDIADRAYVLNHGRLAAHGTAAELDEQIDTIAAGYLGGDAGH